MLGCAEGSGVRQLKGSSTVASQGHMWSFAFASLAESRADALRCLRSLCWVLASLECSRSGVDKIEPGQLSVHASCAACRHEVSYYILGSPDVARYVDHTTS